jgi:heterotetrameric sarcosine oxidase delta subunit
MRLTCPCCGLRDRREFTWIGASEIMARPRAGAPPEAWHDYIHLRDNPAGPSRELWYHDPCGMVVLVGRDTVTHEVTSSAAAQRAARSRAKFVWDEGDFREVPDKGLPDAKGPA